MQLKEFDIPIERHWGRSGFLKVVDSIMKLGFVQEIRVTTTKIFYSRMMKPGEELVPLKFDFDELNPYAIIRNNAVQELLVEKLDPFSVLFHMFDRVSMDRLYPIAFATGGDTNLWSWLKPADRVTVLDQEMLFGIPIFRDRGIDDQALFLCSGPSRDGSLADTLKSLKIHMEVS
jgi:hypothetical protein